MAKVKKNRTTVVSRQEEKKKNGKLKGIVIAACIVVVLAVVAFVLIGSSSTGIYAEHTNACTVGDIEVPTGVYNFYYGESYYNIQNTYQTQSIETALGGATKVREIVNGYATMYVQQDYALCAAAEAAGYTLSAEGQETVDTAVSEMIQTASTNNFDDVDHYLECAVGKGCNLENYRTYMEIKTLASEYKEYYRQTVEITEAAIDDEYNADPSAYDMYSFYSFYMAGKTVAEGEAIAATVTDIPSYVAMTQENCTEDEADTYASETGAFRENYRTRVINNNIFAWIQEDGRAEGDVGVIDYNDGSGVFIVYYVSKNEDMSVTRGEVEADLRSDAVTELVNGLAEEYPLDESWIGMQGVARFATQ